ncbi:MAG: DUF6377 domain-containing protein [Bacteroidales bacterium]|nr:DUF6377 domain-containing protein [Bacteroidales bacterium]
MRLLCRLLYVLLAALLSCAVFPAAAWGENVDSILQVLDKEILRCNEYKMKKEQRLDSLKRNLHSNNVPRHNYDMCSRLYEEYKKYQFDSTYVYATRMLDYAEMIGDREIVAHAKNNLIFCQISAGFYVEAWEIIKNFDTSGLSTPTLQEFYSRCVLFYQNMSVYGKGVGQLGEIYDAKRREAVCNEIELAQVNCDTITLRLTGINLMEISVDSMISFRRQTLERFRFADGDLAVQDFILAELYEKKGDIDRCIFYMALAAIRDIRSNTHETAAAKRLALFMLDCGDIDRAVSYIHLAQKDAEFYGARTRMMETGSALQMIESVRYNKVKEQRIIYFAILSIVFISLVFLVIFIVGLRRKNKALHSARLVIEKKVAELDQANGELSAVNSKLKEANEIKDSYVIQSLYSDTEFVNHVEEKCKSMSQKIKAKQYADLSGLIHDIGVKQERERMSSAFDSTFLKLFPNFIEEYNRLFPAEYRVNVAADGTLPTEVRIFALMRLGIKDAVIVANYLNLSLNTVYVYKAKVKSRSVVKKEEFDSLIMQIPKL